VLQRDGPTGRLVAAPPADGVLDFDALEWARAGEPHDLHAGRGRLAAVPTRRDEPARAHPRSRGPPARQPPRSAARCCRARPSGTSATPYRHRWPREITRTSTAQGEGQRIIAIQWERLDELRPALDAVLAQVRRHAPQCQPRLFDRRRQGLTLPRRSRRRSASRAYCTRNCSASARLSSMPRPGRGVRHELGAGGRERAVEQERLDAHVVVGLAGREDVGADRRRAVCREWQAAALASASARRTPGTPPERVGSAGRTSTPSCQRPSRSAIDTPSGLAFRSCSATSTAEIANPAQPRGQRVADRAGHRAPGRRRRRRVHARDRPRELPGDDLGDRLVPGRVPDPVAPSRPSTVTA
jgi:hypothetical protein